MKIWDMQTGQEVCTLRGHGPARLPGRAGIGHTQGVYGVSFSPDGRLLATAGGNGTVTIWDGTPLAETPARDSTLELEKGRNRRKSGR